MTEGSRKGGKRKGGREREQMRERGGRNRGRYTHIHTSIMYVREFTSQHQMNCLIGQQFLLAVESPRLENSHTEMQDVALCCLHHSVD